MLLLKVHTFQQNQDAVITSLYAGLHE